jgi:large subunit ribosomal protein L14e
LKRLSLTDVVVERLPRGARVNNIEKAWKEQDILNKWESSSWAKKNASKKTRAGLNDFQRFKVMLAKKQRSKIVNEKLAQLK